MIEWFCLAEDSVVTRKETMTTEQIITELKPKFARFHALYKTFAPKAREFASVFCTSFLDWQDSLPAETRKDNGTQIGFVRALYPEVSDDREQYRTDPLYMTAQYLYRIGLKGLKQEAKTAVDAGKATDRQKKLAVSKSRKSPNADGSTSAKGVKIPLVTLLGIIANCKISPVVFNAAVALSALKPDIQKALIASYLDAQEAFENAA